MPFQTRHAHSLKVLYLLDFVIETYCTLIVLSGNLYSTLS